MEAQPNGVADLPRVLFVVNPKSGNNSGDDLHSLIESRARQDNFTYAIYKMRGDDEKEIRAKISEYDPGIVAAVGGDGTVKLIAEMIHNTEIKLAIIPYGSANGMAKELNIGGRVDSALELISTHMVKTIDLLRINKEICIHLGDVGLNARVVKRFENDKKRGILTYAKHLFGEIFLLEHIRLNVQHDDQKHRVKAVSITFANASKYGTGAVINPEGKLDDGEFELVIVKPFPNVKLLSIAWKMFNNKLHTSDYVEIIKCKKAKVSISRKTTLQVDGEVIGKVKEVVCEVIPGCLNVLVPKDH